METLVTPAGLVDRYGRRITYLRLSVTDRCDFRCCYCMGEDMVFLPRPDVLSLEECLAVARTFAGLGVEKIRITGGEPLVRRDILWLLTRIAALPGIRQLVLTTNGSQLSLPPPRSGHCGEPSGEQPGNGQNFAQALKDAGVSRLNISLDTLRADRFHEITRTGRLEQVLAGIQAAQAAGFQRTKLNVVAMRGVNDDECADLVRFALDNTLDITFIEEMPLGDIAGRDQTFLSSEEVLALLERDFPLTPTTENTGGPARYWRIGDHATRIGLISPHSHNFCSDCNRVRVTAKGELYPCLGHNDVIDLRPALRQQSGTDSALQQQIVDSMGIKPLQHDFTRQITQPQVVRFMSMTGG